MKSQVKVLWVFCLMAGCLLIGCREAKRYHDQTPVQLTDQKDSLLRGILAFQEETNAFFRDPETSPLPDRYRKNFEGLDFFSPDTSFRVWARLERSPSALPFDMPTTTDRKAVERKYGTLYFKLKGQDFSLEVYQSPELMIEEGYEDYLFLPFTDQTNGEATYGGGRYLDLRIPEGDSILLDFNRSYNPYCVYNPKYSCPLVPRVNHLQIPVSAGLKDFKP
ncbi:DUF1684 domain-containing protein [Robiginitalea sp. IMCC43444]|uniref:DUF1684 domain-containing protein n=1 Tax=Robiginitalea sp. IMCC43444 TaxID=3459121 RepID=UPI004042F09E